MRPCPFVYSFDFFFMCMGILPSCMSVFYVCVLPECQVPWELELQPTISCQVGAGNKPGYSGRALSVPEG